MTGQQILHLQKQVINFFSCQVRDFCENVCLGFFNSTQLPNNWPCVFSFFYTQLYLASLPNCVSASSKQIAVKSTLMYLF